MIVRALDQTGDWTFGKGKNDYLVNNAAVAQNVATRLRSFLGDCFFDVTSGLDWFNLLGSKDQSRLSLAVTSSILNTTSVTAILSLAINISTTRVATMSYVIETVYGRLNRLVEQNLG